MRDVGAVLWAPCTPPSLTVPGKGEPNPWCRVLPWWQETHSHGVRGSTTGEGDVGRHHFPEEYDTLLVPPAFQPASDLAMAPQTENEDRSKNCSTLLQKSSLRTANSCTHFFLDIMKPRTGGQLFTPYNKNQSKQWFGFPIISVFGMVSKEISNRCAFNDQLCHKQKNHKNIFTYLLFCMKFYFYKCRNFK